MRTIFEFRSYRLLVSLWLFITLLLFASPAKAQESQDRAKLAEDLFNRGRLLEQAGLTQKACEAYEEGWRVDSNAAGNLLALAACLEKAQKTASAFARYQEILDLARRLGRTAREQEALRKMAELEPYLHRLIIHVDDPIASLEGLEIHRNGKIIPRDSWNKSIFVDPEPQDIEATAPNRPRFVAHPVLLGPGMTTEVTVVLPPTAASEPNSEPFTSPAAPQPTPKVRTSPIRNVGYVVGGVGLAGLIVGTALTIDGWVEHGHANEEGRSCGTNSSCYAVAKSHNRSAQSIATAGNITGVAGAVLLATGAAMIFFKSEPSNNASRVGLGLSAFDGKSPLRANLRIDW